MAHEIKLEAYTVRIRPANSKEQYLTLSNFGGNDLYEIFQEYLAHLDVLDKDEKLKKAIRLNQENLTFQDTRKRVSGLFACGGYGLESDIFSLEDSSLKTKKEVNDVDAIPFYFLLHVPRNLNVAFLLLQRTGIFGISTIMHKTLYKFIRDNYPEYVIEFSPLISRALVDEYLENGSVKELILRRYSPPEDKAETLTMGEYKEKIHSVELRIKAKGYFENILGRVNQYLANPNGVFFDVPELNAIGFDENVKYSVVAEVDGAQRTFNLSDIMKLQPYYNVHHQLEIMDSGHPEFGSIDHVAKALLKEITKDLE